MPREPLHIWKIFRTPKSQQLPENLVFTVILSGAGSRALDPSEAGTAVINCFLKAKEKALCRLIDRLNPFNLAVRPYYVIEAANYMLSTRCSKEEREDPPTVGYNWTIRFLKRYNYKTFLQRLVNRDRKDAEDLVVITEYFEKLHELIATYGIIPEDIWNMDETGFRIGIGKNALVISKRKYPYRY